MRSAANRQRRRFDENWENEENNFLMNLIKLVLVNTQISIFIHIQALMLDILSKYFYVSIALRYERLIYVFLTVLYVLKTWNKLNLKIKSDFGKYQNPFYF